MPQETRTYTCPFCKREQSVTATLWESVYGQVLLHFSQCAPPERFPDTPAVMDAAQRIADALATDSKG